MNVANAELIELVACLLKNIARTYFEQWKESEAEDAPVMSQDVFNTAFLV